MASLSTAPAESSDPWFAVEPAPEPGSSDGAPPRSPLVLAALVRYRRVILATTAAAAVVAVAVSLMLPNYYQAQARLLIPSSSGSLLGAASSLSGLSKAFLGGKVGDYQRPLAILSSRSVADAAIDSFNLQRVYEIEPGPAAREQTRDAFAESVTTGVDEEYDFLYVNVEDRSPQRAAALANFLVRHLNALDARLNMQSAGNVRSYIEERYNAAMAAADSLFDRTQAFQQRYGVFDLPTQAEAYFTELGALNAAAIRADVEYQAQRQLYGEEAPQVLAAAEAARQAQARYEAARRGGQDVLPVPRGGIPAVAREYTEIERERVLQTTIIETLAPLLEQARFDELRRNDAVQVVDLAVPPATKARPRRSIIVVSATLSALLLALLFALAAEWWRRHARTVRAQLLAAGR